MRTINTLLSPIFGPELCGQTKLGADLSDQFCEICCFWSKSSSLVGNTNSPILWDLYPRESKTINTLNTLLSPIFGPELRGQIKLINFVRIEPCLRQYPAFTNQSFVGIPNWPIFVNENRTQSKTRQYPAFTNLINLLWLLIHIYMKLIWLGSPYFDLIWNSARGASLNFYIKYCMRVFILFEWNWFGHSHA